VDIARGAVCEVRDEQQSRQVPLADLEVAEADPNCQYIDDYRYWLCDTQEAAEYDEEEDDAYWDDEDKDGEEDREDDEEDHEYDEEDFGPRLADFDDSHSHPEPIRRDQPPVGRNDPCLIRGRAMLYRIVREEISSRQALPLHLLLPLSGYPPLAHAPQFG
jgi:hypothetical protein